MWVTKLLISPVKKEFLPKNDQIWPKIGIFGPFGPRHIGLFGALLVGRLVVVARGPYLARHLFTLYYRHHNAWDAEVCGRIMDCRRRHIACYSYIVYIIYLTL